MRKTLHILATLLLLAACKPTPADDVIQEPEFPQAAEYSIDAGSGVSIDFSANLDWEVSIPTAQAAYFYIDDAGIKAYRVKGKAGNASVRICAESLSGTFKERVCEVSISMGSKSSLLARVSLLAVESSVKIYPVKKNEDGSFVYLSNGYFDYEQEPATELHLTWPEGLSSYNLPVKIVSNVACSISKYPDWMTVSSSSIFAAETALSIIGNPYNYPMDSDTGTISFMDNRTQEVVYSIPIRIDGSKDILYVSLDRSTIDLNVFGEYFQNGKWNSKGCPLYLTATTDAVVVAAGGNDWIKINSDFPGGEQDGKVVQDRLFYISADRNEGEPRSAAVYAIPGYLASTLDLNSIPAQYDKYIVATVSQAGVDPEANWGVISPVNSAYEMGVMGAGLERTSSELAIHAALMEKYGTDEIYTLGYNNWSSSETTLIACLEEFTHCTFATPDGFEFNYSDCLSLVYPQEDNHNIFLLNVDYFEEGYECYAVLRKEDESVVAVIICRLTENFWPVTDYKDIRFSAYDYVGDNGDPDGLILPVGANLTELTSGSIYDQFASYGIPVWKISYETEESRRNAMIYVPPFPVGNSGSVEINPDKSWISVEGGITENNKTFIHVSMTKEDPYRGTEGYIVLRGGGRPLFVLVCERLFMN